MTRLPTVTLAPAPDDTGAARAARRRFLTLALICAALIGAVAGLIDTRALP